MKNELVIPGLANLPSTSLVDFGDYGSGLDFLPRVQLVAGNSKYIMQQKIAPGHYGIPQGEDEIVDLGKSVDILPLAVRDKALDTTQDPPVAVYDKTDPYFADISDRASTKDSGCMFGPSFIVLLRDGNLYELFLGNKSGRIESPKLAPFLPVHPQDAERLGVKSKGATPCTLSSKHVTKVKNPFIAPVVTQCSTPWPELTEAQVARINKEVEKFLSAKSDNAGEAAPAGARSR